MHPAPMPVLTIDRIDVGRLRRHATKIAAIRSVVGRASCEPLERPEAAQQHGRSNADHKREQSDDETKKKAPG